MRCATSAIAHQSARASPGRGKKPRWRDTRRSELVTVPSFSPQPSAGSFTCANRSVSVSAMQSDTTTNGQLASATRAMRASGIDTAGLVAMIHTALIRPLAIASNMSTAFSPGREQIVGDCQKRCARSRSASENPMCTASVEASPPTSRPPIALGWPVMLNGPAPGMPIRPVARWRLMIALALSVPLVDWFTPWLNSVIVCG